MKPADLVEGLRDYLSMSRLEPDSGGVFTIVFDDGLDVEFLALNDKLLLVRSRVADVPDAEIEHEAFYCDLLKHNLIFLREQTAVLSLDDEAGKVWLSRTASVDDVHVAGFCELIEDFVNTLQWWRQFAARETAAPAAARFSALNMLRP